MDTTFTSLNWGPHEGPQADVYSGEAATTSAGKSYGTSTHQEKLGCVDCHMPEVATNAKSANHSFYPQVSACISCHSGVTNFDVNGGRSQTKAGVVELQKALNDAGYLTRSTAAPYLPLTSAQLADGNFPLDKTQPAGGPDGGTLHLTPDQAGAVYNYILVARDASLGAHNPKYTRQLIFDAYFVVTSIAISPGWARCAVPTIVGRPMSSVFTPAPLKTSAYARTGEIGNVSFRTRGLAGSRDAPA